MVSKLIEKLALALDSAGIDYMIIGGQAVLLYGEPRATRDVDITLGAGPESVAEILVIAKKLKLRILTKAPEEFARTKFVLPAVSTRSGFRVDFVFSMSTYERQALKRVRKVKLGRARVRFASPEDIIIQKIVSGRPRDLEDVKSIISKQKALDLKYVEAWLSRIENSSTKKFSGRLQKLRREIS